MNLAVRVTPRAGANRIDGIVATADGGTALKLSVTAPPSDNRANTAVLRLLAREWRLPLGGLTILAGTTSRNKIIAIKGDANALMRDLAAKICGPPHTR